LLSTRASGDGGVVLVAANGSDVAGKGELHVGQRDVLNKIFMRFIQRKSSDIVKE
jgi:hypothetical protein